MASDDLTEIWRYALIRYQQASGIDLSTGNNPLHGRFPNSIDELLNTLDGAQHEFLDYRKKGENVRSVLSTTMLTIKRVIDLVGGAVSDAFPLSGHVFGAVLFVFNAAKSVSKAYDAILEMFEKFRELLDRLPYYARPNIDVALKKLLAKDIALILEIMGLSTKLIEDRRGKLFAKALILGDDPTIGSRLRELESNIMQEMLLVPAMTLDIQYEQRDVLYGLRQNMSAMDYHMRESLLQGPDSRLTEEQRLQKILKDLAERLDPIEVKANQKDCSNFRHALMPKTGEWLFANRIFNDWVDLKHWLLLLSGHEGFGKTHLCARIVEYLTQNHVSKEPAARTDVAFFFCRQNTPTRRQVPVILRTLAMQIANSNPVYARFLHEQTGSPNTSYESTRDIWENFFVEYFINKEHLEDRVYLVLDGLDEADVEGPDGLDTFFEVLKEWARQSLSSQRRSFLQILLVGRPEIDHRLSHRDFLGRARRIELTEYAQRRDVAKYIQRETARIQSLDDSLRERLIHRLSGKSFLWVKLVLDEITRKHARRARDIEQALEHMPRSLEDMLDQIMRRFSDTEENPRDLNTLLTWAIYGKRPLTLEEADVVIALNDEDYETLPLLENVIRKDWATFFTLNRIDGRGTSEIEAQFALHRDAPPPAYKPIEGEPPEEEVAVEVIQFDSPKETTEVHISHLAISEYLRRPIHSTSASSISKVGVSQEKADLTIALTCLTFICEPYKVSKWSCQSFLDYSANNFILHLVAASRTQVDQMERGKFLEYLHMAFIDPDIIRRWSSRVIVTNILVENRTNAELLLSFITEEQTPEVTAPLEVTAWIEDLRKGGLRVLLEPVIMDQANAWLCDVDNDDDDVDHCQEIYQFVKGLRLYRDDKRYEDEDADFSDVSANDIRLTAQWAGFEENTVWLYSLATVLRRKAYYQDAIDAFMGAMLLSPHPNMDRLNTEWGLMHTYYELNRVDETLKWANTALKDAQDLSVISSQRNITAWRAKYATRFATSAVSNVRVLTEVASDQLHSFWRDAFDIELDHMDGIHDFLICAQQFPGWVDDIRYMIDTLANQRCYHIQTNNADTSLSELTHFLLWAGDGNIGDHILLQWASAQAGRQDVLNEQYSRALNYAADHKSSNFTKGLHCVVAMHRYTQTGMQQESMAMVETVLNERKLRIEDIDFRTITDSALRTLAEYLYNTAADAERTGLDIAETYISRLKYLQEPITCREDDEPGSDSDKPQVPDAVLLMGRWYLGRNDIKSARLCFWPRLSAALDILTDDTPFNDDDGFLELGNMLVHMGDLRGSQAAFRLYFTRITRDPNKTNTTVSRANSVPASVVDEAEPYQHTTKSATNEVAEEVGDGVKSEFLGHDISTQHIEGEKPEDSIGDSDVAAPAHAGNGYDEPQDTNRASDQKDTSAEPGKEMTLSTPEDISQQQGSPPFPIVVDNDIPEDQLEPNLHSSVIQTEDELQRIDEPRADEPETATIDSVGTDPVIDFSSLFPVLAPVVPESENRIATHKSWYCSGSRGTLWYDENPLHRCISGCLENDFCDSCLELLKNDQMPFVVCNKSHKFMRISQDGHPWVPYGKVVFTKEEEQGFEEEVMDLAAWYDQLREKWRPRTNDED